MTDRRKGDDDAMDFRRVRNNGPWWTRWGLVGVLILGMLGVTTGIVPSALTQTKQAVEETTRQIKEHREKEEQLRRELVEKLEEQSRIMRAVCVGVARTEEARERCLR